MVDFFSCKFYIAQVHYRKGLYVIGHMQGSSRKAGAGSGLWKNRIRIPASKKNGSYLFFYLFNKIHLLLISFNMKVNMIYISLLITTLVNKKGKQIYILYKFFNLNVQTGSDKILKTGCGFDFFAIADSNTWIRIRNPGHMHKKGITYF